PWGDTGTCEPRARGQSWVSQIAARRLDAETKCLHRRPGNYLQRQTGDCLRAHHRRTCGQLEAATKGEESDRITPAARVSFACQHGVCAVAGERQVQRKHLAWET